MKNFEEFLNEKKKASPAQLAARKKFADMVKGKKGKEEEKDDKKDKKEDPTKKWLGKVKDDAKKDEKEKNNPEKKK